MWVNLHTHSYYSFLQGLASPLELARAAADQGSPALALTDHGLLTGAIEFYDACQSSGVQPILGLELRVHVTGDQLLASAATKRNEPSQQQPAGNLVLLAENMAGWSNLCRISSYLQTGLEDSLELGQLADWSAGLICLSGGRRGLAAAWLSAGVDKESIAIFDQLKSIFPQRCYIELQTWQGAISKDDRRWFTSLLQIGNKLGLPLLASAEVFYLHPEQAHLQRVVSAIRLNQPIDQVPEQFFALPGATLIDEKRLFQILETFPIDHPQQAIDNTLEVAGRCRLSLPLGEHHYPQFNPEEGCDLQEVLRRRAERGARQRYGTLTLEIQSRLDHELQTIEACGYSSLFLIMEDILGFARQAGVPVSSRGSAASSLVAHCLGITSPDPLRLNLYFERFLNPMRVTPPDIDTDLCSRRRDQVIQYVYQRFGHERVAMVATISRFRSRSALREVAKAYGLTTGKISSLLEKLPYRWYGGPGREENGQEVYSELSGEFPYAPYPNIFLDAQALLGIPRHLSIHPGGIVIAPGLMTDLAPVQLAPKGINITQFDLTSIERLGMLKMDLLGIRGLTVLGDVAESIPTLDPTTGERMLSAANLEDRASPGSGASSASVIDILDKIPLDDLATSETVQQARTIGCFQIESPGMRATLREIQARTQDDIMVALALYRPGPLTGGLKDAFVERFRAQANLRKKDPNHPEVSNQNFYLHPALEPLLRETYGVILYQEQVLRIAHELAGFSLSDADLLRRAMSHFDLDKQMQVLQNKFIAGAEQQKGVPAAIAERIWELMAAFAGYGFPKAHAASYAAVAWQAAWCKTHFPEIFMAAVLANWGGYYSQRVYLTEARRMGLTIRPPHVNHAGVEFSVHWLEGQAILFMGLGQVRELTQSTIGRILRERPFRSLSDFLARVDPRQQEALTLIRVGALEGFGSQPNLLRRMESQGWRAGQLSLFPDEMLQSEDSPKQDDWSLSEKVAAQEAILGVSLAAHPLELIEREIKASGAMTTVEAASKIGKLVRVAGMRQTWRRSRTQKGDPIYFMSLEDLEGMLDVIIPGEVYQKYRGELSGPGPYLVEGMLDLNPNTSEPTVRATRFTRLKT